MSAHQTTGRTRPGRMENSGDQAPKLDEGASRFGPFREIKLVAETHHKSAQETAVTRTHTVETLTSATTRSRQARKGEH